MGVIIIKQIKKHIGWPLKLNKSYNIDRYIFVAPF